MGKIRVKSFDESQEDKDKKLKAKREAKKTARVAGMGGGERTVMVGPTEEELTAQQPPTEHATEEIKDLSAGAVLVFSFISLIIGVLILGKYFLIFIYKFL